MNSTDSRNPKSQNDPGNDALADLFRQVPARKAPPAEDEQMIREAVHTQWREITRNRRRKTWAWALAASVVIAVVSVVRFIPDTPVSDPILTVASIDKISGAVTAFSTNGPVVLNPDASQDLMTGLTIRSASASGAGLRWLNGTLIRLDENTELKLISIDEIFLRSGRVYLDTLHVRNSGKELVISTPHGLVRHLGTQFMTQSSTSGLVVSVREGEVLFQPTADNRQESAQAGVGQRLEVSPGGKFEVQPIPTWGDDWNWAEALSPGFRSDGRSLADLFDWAGRELGRRVEYASPSAESVAATTVMHGNLDIQPAQALSVATATSDLSARLSEGSIVISMSRDS